MQRDLFNSKTVWLGIPCTSNYNYFNTLCAARTETASERACGAALSVRERAVNISHNRLGTAQSSQSSFALRLSRSQHPLRSKKMLSSLCTKFKILWFLCSLPGAHTLCARTIPLSSVQNNEKSTSAFAISIACTVNFHHSCFNHRRVKTSPRIAPPNKNYAPHFTHYATKNLTFFILSLVTVSTSDKRQKKILGRQIVQKSSPKNLTFFIPTLFRNRQIIWFLQKRIFLKRAGSRKNRSRFFFSNRLSLILSSDFK